MYYGYLRIHMKNIFLSLSILVFHFLGLKAQPMKLDSTFNAIGYTLLETGNSDKCTSSVLQPDGKLLLCGWTLESGQEADVLLIRLMPDGSLDNSFGLGGIVRIDYDKHTEKANAIALQADGRIVITGTAYNQNYPHEYDFATLRLNPDGSIDKSFGNEGWVITDLGTNEEFASVIAIQTDGKIVSAGRIDVGGHSDFAMVRYLPDGSVDSLFGNGGVVQTTFFNDWRTWDEAHAIAIFPDGKILLGGYAYRPFFGLAKYNPDGSLDSTFGEHGLVTMDFGNFRSGVINTIQLTDDGGFLAGGPVGNMEFPWKGNIAIVRYQSNGDLYTEFGINGIAKISIGEQSIIGDMRLMPDGRIIIGGTSNIIWETQDDWLLARLTPNGELDASFDSDGYVIHMMEIGTSNVNQVLIQPDDKIILAGYTSASPSNIGVVRFMAEETSAVQDFNPNVTFQISPNPSNGNFEIDIGNNQFTDLQIRIYTVLGESVFRKNISAKFDNKFEIEASNLESGSYIIQLLNEKYSRTQQLIIQN